MTVVDRWPLVGASTRTAAAFRLGVRDTRASIVALAPIGFIAGVVGAAAAGPLVGWAAGPLLVSGAAHFAVISMGGAGLLGVMIVVAVLMSRCAIYSAALAPDFVHQPRWFRWLGSYVLVDQVFAIVDARRSEHRRPEELRAHYLGAALPLYSMWLTTMAAGAIGGSALPPSLRLELGVVALVVSMLRPALAGHPARVGAAVAAGVALTANGLPHGAGLLVGAVAGMVAGRHVARSAEEGEVRS